MKPYTIGALEDYPLGSKKCVELEGKSIGIFNVNGQLYALRNVCPHQGAPLCEGSVNAWVTASKPYQFEYEREGEIVRCPWHQWEFDIKTGCMVVDPKMRTKSYDVTVETFDISVNSGNVILHL
ncbi:Rieske (2Fe-2S) protein [Paenibacillus alginolyticus]|uniref:Rieske 2Fe-2S domain-containing protein n=1 Tax=Paenibacillus alginolyticus TaxID=59839 RepID=A0ABT4GPM4_9BACL|nr:Rieske 2Fe-2S domain-containing protein [Paenibacillus alginolyticus]MCY9698173.1 Rieske 2Fe-2S domain-containing protein [Paenibacillus alginolyticus]MEC0146719.1 Rieske 2Fe-2S domain-containing protein [Paenibacillus alginolyticus]